MLENPLELTHNFNILPEKDYNFIAQFNNTSCDYEDNICLHRKFEIQADKTPDAPALIAKDTRLTYKETDIHINFLANYIISKGVRPGDVVAISCERSIEMMIGILAILKAGACYLPLQIDNPSERTTEIINDSNPKLILSSKSGAININNKDLIVYIDNILREPLSQNSSRPNLPTDSKSLAYILYTSGSTGKPKGTLIEHHSVLNRIGWMQKSYPLTSADVLLQKTPITFDVSVWELFWWFFNGSKLVLLNFNGEKDPAAIADYIHKFSVTQIHFVPSMFSPFLYYIKQNNLSENIKSLRHIFLSGEGLPPQIVAEFNQLREINDLPAIVNLYGPTEATVDVSYYNCSNELSETDKVYIGKPIDNTNLFIVNQNLKIQPVGVKGELLITGVNLSRGYLNKPELTNKSFVNFINQEGKEVRAYKTGDIAVLSPIEEIEYLGRIDNQVKIRGMRIELGEIESKLLQHPKIMGVAVIVAFEGEHKAIIGYISPKSGEHISQEELTEYISTKVPPHMVPSQFIFIDTIPLTSSGKLNRKALPAPTKEIKTGSLIKPASAYEEELLTLWQDILQVQNISVTDNFFDIGGNSLLAIKLAMKIDEHFKVPVTVVSVLEHTNIREFSKFLNTFDNNILDETAQNIALANERRKNIVRKNRIRLD
jgi:amino acid adenylation domain-containing protein